MKAITKTIISVRDKLKLKGITCKSEYVKLGYDLICDNGKKYLIKRIRSTGKVTLTYRQAIEGWEEDAHILIINKKDEVLGEISVREFILMFYGLKDKKYIISLGKKYVTLKPNIVPGYGFIAIKVFLPTNEYKEILKYTITYNNPIKLLAEKLKYSI